MKIGFLIIIGISATTFLIGVIVYPLINETTFDDEYPHSIQSALDNIPTTHPESKSNTPSNFTKSEYGIGKNSIAKDIFSKCKQDDECTIEYMQKISKTHDRQIVLDTIHDLITIYDAEDFYCHPIAHHLGEFLLGYVNGDMAEAAKFIDSRCASGVLHGITENTITIQTLLHQKNI